jgi:drug/metabolite transporter (DMT)-like permease
MAPQRLLISSKKRWLAIVSIILVALCYVILSMVSRILEPGFGDYTQVYLRISIGTLMAALLFRRHITWSNYTRLKPKDWLGITLMGVVGYGIVVAALTIGVLNTTLINTSIIYATVPVFVYIFSLPLLKRKPELIKIALVLVSFWGVGMISSNSVIPHLEGINHGDWWVLFAAVCGALYVIGRKLVSDTLNNRELAVIVMAIAAITTFALSLINGDRVDWSVFGVPSILVGLVIGSVLNIAATFLENYGFKILDETFAAQLLMVESVFALVLGRLFYAEVISLTQILGMLVISSSLLLMNRVAHHA